MQITKLVDGEGHIPPDMLLNGPGWPDGTLDENGLLHVQFAGFFLRAAGQNIVVDTGFGGGAFTERLPVEPEDVDVVIFSHLHWDHVGWSALFTGAEYHCHALDWDYWVEQAVPETAPGREDFGAIPAPERLGSLSVHKHASERTEIVPGVTLRLAPGHSPGHCIVELDGAVILADAAHHPAQLLSEGWSCAADEDAALAASTREALASELSDSGRVIAMTHHPHMGRLVTVDGARAWARPSGG